MPNFIARSSVRNDRPSRRRLFPGMHTTALSTRARGLVGVKSREKRRQVLDQICRRDFDAVDERPALKAEPLEPVFVIRTARALDDKPDRACDQALRRVTKMRRQQKKL